MDTKLLYYSDAYLTEFTATVLSCEEAKDGFRVTLDRTAFYPEGGGQPADHGTLGIAHVTDVHEKGGVVFHNCDQAVEIGTTVFCVLDWERRFDHMQQHSGEHIISGILCDLYHCDNVGFHLGADSVTIDYNAELTWDAVLAAEAKANGAIWADEAVQIDYPGEAALKQWDYRSKKELSGQVRIVTFPGTDCCACCGTHVRRAGSVGLIKVLSCQKFREGVRLEILCGQRALTYLSGIYEQSRSIAQHLSVKPLETLAAVERIEGELSAVKLRMVDLEDQLFFHIASKFVDKGDCMVFQPTMRPDAVRKLADAIAKQCGGLAAVFSGADGQPYTYALVQASGNDIATLVKALNAALKGRGGGRNGFAQGSVTATQQSIEDFWACKEGV